MNKQTIIFCLCSHS